MRKKEFRVSDTYSDILRRWQIPFEPRELLIPKDSYQTHKINGVKAQGCAHDLEDEWNFANEEVSETSFNDGSLWYCYAHHVQFFTGPNAEEARRALHLLFIAENFHAYEKRIQSIVAIFFDSSSGAEIPPLNDFLASLRATRPPKDALFAKFLFSYDDKMDELYPKFWNDLEPMLGEALEQRYNLSPLAPEEPSVFALISGMPLNFFKGFKKVYPTFEVATTGWTENVLTVVAELPLSFVGGKKLLSRLEYFPHFNIRKMFWVNEVIDPPVIKEIYLKTNTSSELSETLKVLVKEMPFFEAMEASRALSENP